MIISQKNFASFLIFKNNLIMNDITLTNINIIIYYIQYYFYTLYQSD